MPKFNGGEFFITLVHFPLHSLLCSPRPVTELKTVEQEEQVITRPEGITTFSFFFSFLSFFFSFFSFFVLFLDKFFLDLQCNFGLRLLSWL